MAKTPVPEMRTKGGKVTPYAFSCGAVERRKDVVLSHQNGCYMVTGRADGKWIEPRGYRTLTEARRAMRVLATKGA